MQTRLKRVTYSKRAKWVIYPTAAVAITNFGALIIASAYLHGDALNGYVRAGHFFVCAKGRICNEVSSVAWHFSYWQEWSVIAGILLVFVENVVFQRTGDIKWQ